MAASSGQPNLRQSPAHLRIAGAVVGVALLSAGLAACSTSSKTSSQSPAVSGNLRSINQSALQGVVANTARELDLPGAFVRLSTPQGEFTATYGTTQLGSQIQPQPYTQVRIGSITKTMTSAVILQLAQEGKLPLSDPVSKYVTGVPNGDHITIAMLLEMRSGLFNYTATPEMTQSLDNDPTKVWTPQELLAIAFARPPNLPPDTAYEYNNTNYVLLGLIIEDVDHEPLAAAFQKRLFEPLGMKHTMLPPTTSNRIPTPFAHGYLYGSSSVVLLDIPTPPYTPEFQAAVRAGTIKPKDYTSVNPSWGGAAGGVTSTANDLGTWIRALVGGRVLNQEYQRLWFASPLPTGGAGFDYGFGIARLRWGPNTLYNHGGDTVGYNLEVADDPTNKLTLVIWDNLNVSPFSLSGSTAPQLMLKVLDQAYKLPPSAPGALTPAESG